jgi:hypothetical protein
MMQRWIAPAMGLVLALSVGLAGPAGAFRQSAAKPGPGAAASAPAAGMMKVTGIIKGAPAGSTITVVSGKRSTTVDTSHAKVRARGRFASASMLTAGTFVRAEGTMNGTTLDAKSIEILRPAGGNKQVPASKNGKMPARQGAPAKP